MTHTASAPPDGGEWRYHRLRDVKGRQSGVARLRDLPRTVRGSFAARVGALLGGGTARRVVVDLEVELVAGDSAVAPYDFTDSWVRADVAGERDPRWSGWTGPGVSEAVWDDERGVQHWLGAALGSEEGEPWFAHLGGIAMGR